MTLQEYNDLYKEPLEKKVTIQAESGITITNSNILSESMTVESSLCSDNELRYGACESTCFKISIADINHDFTGEWLTVTISILDEDVRFLISDDEEYFVTNDGTYITTFHDNSDNPVTLGRFKVFSDKPSNDRRWRVLTCYDAMYDILNTDVSAWFLNLTFPMTIKNLRDSLFTELGITQVTKTLINDSFTTKGEFSIEGSLSAKDILTRICEINGVFGHITPEGKFDYVDLTQTETLTYDWYIDGTGTYEDYVTEAITGIVARADNDDSGTIVGPDTNQYVIEANQLLYGSEGTTALTTALAALLNKISTITFRPFSVETYGNPALPLGTQITLETSNKTIVSYVINKYMSGVQQLKDKLSANSSNKQMTLVNSMASKIVRIGGKIHKIENDVDTLRSTITDLETNVESEIEQLADQILLKVDSNGRIVEVALGVSAESGTEFKVVADNLDLSANDVFNIMSGGTMNLTAKNIAIESDNFTVTEDGEVTASKMNITGGSLDIRNNTSNPTIVHIQGREGSYRRDTDISAGNIDVVQYASDGISKQWGTHILPRYIEVSNYTNGEQDIFHSLDLNGVMLRGASTNVYLEVNGYGSATSNFFTGLRLMDKGASYLAKHCFLLTAADTSVLYATDTYTNLHSTSSRKVKENIEDMTEEDAMKLLQLEPVKFDYKEGFGDKNQRGFIAEDVEKIIPQVVTPETQIENDIQYASINYIGIIPYLTKMIQIQQDKIDTLEQRIAKLENIIIEERR